MKRTALHAFIISELCLLLGLIVSLAILPAALGANAGVSYFGVHISSAIPYGLGLLSAGGFVWQAAGRLRKHQRLLSGLLYCMGPLYAGIVATPYSAGPVFDWIHTSLGSVLFALELLVSGYLAFGHYRDKLNVSLWLIELAGGIISALYLAPSHGYLLQGQLLFQLAFGLLIARILAATPAALTSPYRPG